LPFFCLFFFKKGGLFFWAIDTPQFSKKLSSFVRASSGCCRHRSFLRSGRRAEAARRPAPDKEEKSSAREGKDAAAALQPIQRPARGLRKDFVSPRRVESIGVRRGNEGNPFVPTSADGRFKGLGHVSRERGPGACRLIASDASRPLRENPAPRFAGRRVTSGADDQPAVASWLGRGSGHENAGAASFTDARRKCQKDPLEPVGNESPNPQHRESRRPACVISVSAIKTFALIAPRLAGTFKGPCRGVNRKLRFVLRPLFFRAALARPRGRPSRAAAQTSLAPGGFRGRGV